VAERIIGRYRFQVEEFIPDRIKVEIASDRRAVGPGEELVFDVTSHYLFGPPAADLPVESRVRLVKSLFSAPGFETFTFHNTQRELSDREIQSFDGTLDGEGKQTFAVKIPAGLEVPSGLAAVVTARVSEQGGSSNLSLSRPIGSRSRAAISAPISTMSAGRRCCAARHRAPTATSRPVIRY
jgi:uncharacterized protein YfaS (alpha-2-macroglobulin family)